MSTTTTNLGLVKPELTDSADITAMNQNWDIIDETLMDRANAPFFATLTGNYDDGYQIDKTFAEIMVAYTESREMLIFDAASSVRLFRFVKASASNVYFAYNNGEDAVSLVVNKNNTVTVTSLSFLNANHANDVTAHSDIRDIALDALTNAGNAQSAADTALEKANTAVPSIGVDPDLTSYTDWKSVLNALPYGSVTIVRKPNINNALLPSDCPDSSYGNMVIRRVNAVYQTSSATLYVRKNNLTHVYEATFAQNTASVTWMKVADAAHNQAASTITAGTFAGQVVANSSGQTPGTSLLRNSRLVSADTNPTVNGEICWTYK